MTAEVMTGGCLCGAVRYEGRGGISAAHVCHCRQCQRWNGGPLYSAGFTDGIVMTADEPVWFKSSDFAERGSCAKCGSALFWRFQDGTSMAATLGSLDHPDAIEPIDTQVFYDHRPAWIDVPAEAKIMTEADCIAALEARNAQ